MDFCSSHSVLISMLTYLSPSHTSRLQAHLTTQPRPHLPLHTAPLQPARKKLHTCQAKTLGSQEKANKTLQPVSQTLQTCQEATLHNQERAPASQEELQPARKKLPPARQTLDGTYTSQLTLFTVSLLTPPHTLHFMLHTAPHFTVPPHTAFYLLSHTSHLTIPASLERTLANQARTPASQ